MSKKTIIILLLIVLIGVIVYLFSREDESSRNEFFVAEKQDLVQEISVVGKVEPTESVNLAFEKTGVLTGIFVEAGQKIERGTLLVQLDTGDAEKRLKDAEVNLESAKLALDKIGLQREQLLRGDVLSKSYEDGLTILSSFYDETAAILSSLDNILFGNALDEEEQNIEYYVEYEEKFSNEPKRLRRLYQEAEELHKKGLIDYQLAERGSGDTRSKVINSGQVLAVKLAEIIKSTRDIIRHLQDYFIEENLVHENKLIIDSHASDLAQYDSVIDGYLENLTIVVNAINDYYDKTESLPLDIRTQELLVKQRENELADAKNNFTKYFLYSPISAVVASLDLKRGEVVTANIPVIELISSSQFEISADIYEEDIVKIKIGAPVEINLPAFPKETFRGRVIFLDAAEKIIDRVVYYEIKIGFDEDLPKGIKSTMTADIVIQTERKENVLVIPEEAVQKTDEKITVEVLQDGKVEEKEIEIGLEGSNDMVEIVSGLNEGEKVILD
ncbi:MAG TPA: efflux RND transporter periplasmic adaptor subunit [Candidatus Humimicrobiaceae bacterium]|nr:efflux RND transporter periplasmic adaptor subunit [Candidatus Humimicrobiaceae bacterium]